MGCKWAILAVSAHGPSTQGIALAWEEGMSATGLVTLLPPPGTPEMQQSAVHLLQEQDTNLPTSSLPTNQD